MKLVHAADLHLDSPLRGLTRYEGAPVARIRGATRQALSNLVDLCVDEEVRLLLLAGDLFDGNWRDYSTGLFFASEMSRLRAADVTVVSLRGNHDAASQLTRHLRLPDNVIELATDAPETRVLEGLGVAVHGQGFATRSVVEDLALRYPQALPGLLNVGLLHTALGGRVGHEPYAPCTLETLHSKGYDYWALGHVHAREVVSEHPHVVFAGNLQGRHARETGPKGATLIHVADGRVERVEPRTLDVVRWQVCDVALGPDDRAEDAVDAVREALQRALDGADGRLLCARVRLSGQCPAHAALHAARDRWLAELRAVANDFGDDVWIEKVEVATTPELDLPTLRERGDAIGRLLGGVFEAGSSEASLGALAAELADVQRKLPPEIADLGEGQTIDDPTFIADALADVEQLLLVRLLAEDQELGGGR